jgi:glycosyltransferase involved in cell wall biosynthesis
MEFSVIVPTLNEEELIESCLKSILAQNFPRKDFEIIVSDGYSSDKTVKIAKLYADKVVVTKKRGLWYGRNFGAKYAKGKYFVFIDADTLIDKSYLKTVHEAFENGYLGVSTLFRFSENFARIKSAELCCKVYYKIKSLIGQDHLFGCNICVSRKGFELTGGFRDLTLEDTGMAKDLKKFGNVKCINRTLVVTSSRRLDDFGVWSTYNYYIDLWIIQKLNLKGKKQAKLIKHNEFKPYTVLKNSSPGNTQKSKKL